MTATKQLAFISAETLDRMIEDVREKLANIEEFQFFEELQAEKILRGHSNGVRFYGGESAPADDREKIISACVQHSKNTKNAPVTMKSLLPVVQKLGITLRGKYPGTTLGAIVTKAGKYEAVPRQKGSWRLIKEIYED